MANKYNEIKTYKDKKKIEKGFRMKKAQKGKDRVRDNDRYKLVISLFLLDS